VKRSALKRKLDPHPTPHWNSTCPDSSKHIISNIFAISFVVEFPWNSYTIFSICRGFCYNRRLTAKTLTTAVAVNTQPTLQPSATYLPPCLCAASPGRTAMMILNWMSCTTSIPNKMLEYSLAPLSLPPPATHSHRWAVNGMSGKPQRNRISPFSLCGKASSEPLISTGSPNYGPRCHFPLAATILSVMKE